VRTDNRRIFRGLGLDDVVQAGRHVAPLQVRQNLLSFGAVVVKPRLVVVHRECVAVKGDG
jgi:hypothetical protein